MNRKPTHDWSWPTRKPNTEPPEPTWKAMTLARARIGNEPWDTLDSHYQERALNRADDDLNQELSDRTKRIEAAANVIGSHPRISFKHEAWNQMVDEWETGLANTSILRTVHRLKQLLPCPSCATPSPVVHGDDPRWQGETPKQPQVYAIDCDSCGLSFDA